MWILGLKGLTLVRNPSDVRPFLRGLFLEGLIFGETYLRREIEKKPQKANICYHILAFMRV